MEATKGMGLLQATAESLKEMGQDGLE